MHLNKTEYSGKRRSGRIVQYSVAAAAAAAAALFVFGS